MSDKRTIINIAADVTAVPNKNISNLLLSISEYIEEQNTNHQKNKQYTWDYGLLPVILQTIKQDDLESIKDYDVMVKLVHLLCECCIGSNASADKEFYNVFLPEIINELTKILMKLQIELVKTSSYRQEKVNKLLLFFDSVLSSLISLIDDYPDIAYHSLQSSCFHKMLMVDHDITVKKLFRAIRVISVSDKKVCSKLDKDCLTMILDEIVYKICVLKDLEIVSDGIQTLVQLCKYEESVSKVLYSKYNSVTNSEKGIQPLLSRLYGSGFDDLLEKFFSILDRENVKNSQMQIKENAASKIQATWRGFYMRKRLVNAEKALTNFKKMYKSKKDLKEMKLNKLKREMTEQDSILQNRLRVMRNLHSKRLETLQILPAGEVNEYLAHENEKAAIQIQSLYRGYSTRKNLKDIQIDRKKDVAAKKIQKSFRGYRNSKMNRSYIKAVEGDTVLSDERRVQLASKINELKYLHPVKTPEDQRLQLHDNVQHLLRERAMKKMDNKRLIHHRQALLAQLKMDSDLLLNPPKLSEITEADLKLYRSTSQPIIMKAKYNHEQELRILKQPWWSRIGDEYQDSKLEEFPFNTIEN